MRKILESAGGGRPPSQYYRVLPAWALGLGLVVVRSFLSPLSLAVPRSRRFRLLFLMVRVRCSFWAARVPVVSYVLNVGSRLVLVLVLRALVLFVCGGFIFPWLSASCWSAHPKNWEVCEIKYPRLNSVPCITAAQSGRGSRIRQFEGPPNDTALVIRATPKGGLVKIATHAKCALWKRDADRTQKCRLFPGLLFY